jgi:TonB family protein
VGGLVSAASENPAASSATRKSDGLLWLAAAAVCATGGAWLFVTKPWGISAPPPAIGIPIEADNAAPTPPAGVEDPLRMADLAFAAGMLVEPEEYSAWTLYGQLAAGAPQHTAAAARTGLEKVASELLRRGTTALEQGRVDDATATAQRILGVLPEHAGAAALAAEIAALADARAAAEREREERRAAARATRADSVTAASDAAKPAADPFAKAHAAFAAAMAGNRLVAPEDDSAKRHLAALVELAPEHEITRAARARLATELASRGRESLEALDTEAAAVWLAEAERAGAAGPELAAVRAKLYEQMVAAQAATPVPASELQVRNYVPPDFPPRALEREIEGWVEVEFTVALDGRTQEIAVIDASHDTYFRSEAVSAVAQWRFEPRVYDGKPVAQRARTRIRFVL